MLKKTKDLALEIAQEHHISEEKQNRIEQLISHAFSAYAEAWKGIHNKAETKRKWEYFFDELIEHRNQMDKALESLLRYSDLKNQWIANFKEVIEIIQGN
jgi:predicted signal transduction protein with EAL and GGDEF domain